MSNQTLKLLTTAVFLLALLVWGGVVYLYLGQDKNSSFSQFLPSSFKVYSDENGLFSLTYDSQKYLVEKQTFNPLSILPTPWISNIPQEKSVSITINRLVDKTGREIFSFYLEEVPFAKKINSINKSGPHFVEQEISPYSLTNTVAGYKMKRTIVLPDPNQNEQETNVFFTEYLYLFPVKNESKSLIIVIPFNNQEYAEKLIGEFLKV